jgi:HSP20 family protein
MSNGITVNHQNEKQLPSREETRASEKYLKPAVSIMETEDGLILTADLPGASKDQLNVNVEKGILTINAPAANDLPGQTLYREFELAPYYRQFQIPESLDQDRAQADFTNGVLTLRIPKAEAAKPRKVEIRVG